MSSSRSGDRLTVQTTRNWVAAITEVNESTFRYDERRSSGSVHVFIKIGSPEYKRMVEFRQCVADNRGRNLFEVEDCGEPPDTGRE